MLDKAYLRNITALKSKLNIQNNRPTFLQDQGWQPVSRLSVKGSRASDKSDKQSRRENNNKERSSTITSKPFNLQQIKKELGLIEMKNSRGENEEKQGDELFKRNKEVASMEFVQVPNFNFKKQKSEQMINNLQERVTTGLKKKQSEPYRAQQHRQNASTDNTGFTDRITQLVRMREQHQQIINSLVANKKPIAFPQKQSFSQVGSVVRNKQLQNQYVKVVQSYEVSNQRRRDKFEEERAFQERFYGGRKEPVMEVYEEDEESSPSKAPKVTPKKQQTKKRSVQEMFEDLQAKINNSQKKKTVKQETQSIQMASDQSAFSSQNSSFTKINIVEDRKQQKQLPKKQLSGTTYEKIERIENALKRNSSSLSTSKQNIVPTQLASEEQQYSRSVASQQQVFQQQAQFLLQQPQSQSQQQSLQQQAQQVVQDLQNDEYQEQAQLQEQEENDELSKLDESCFQIQQHVNLMASLSQFENDDQHSIVHQPTRLQNQLHYSVIEFLQNKLKTINNLSENLAFNKNTKIELKFVCMDSQYQGQSHILSAVRKIKTVNRDFVKIVEYLTENQVWEGLFVCEEMEYENDYRKKYQNDDKQSRTTKVTSYHGLCFDLGSYKQTIISNTPLTTQQASLLTFSSTVSTLTCDISVLLLSRLLSTPTTKTFPQMLHRLFGYQFKTFPTQKLNDFMEVLEYIDRLRDIHNKELRNEGGLVVEDKLDQSLREKYSLRNESMCESEQQSRQEEEGQTYLQDTQKHCDFYLYGVNNTTQSHEIITPSFFSQKNPSSSHIKLYQFRELMKHQKYLKKFSQSYDFLSIINKKELPVKSIQLKHFQNHFVVVSVNVVEEGLHFLSVGEKGDCGKMEQGNGSQLKYRLCLISSTTRTILECLILSNNESYPVYLPSEEFEVYISAFHPQTQRPSNIQSTQSDQPIFTFTFYIQSQHIKAKHDSLNMDPSTKKELQFELRLKEEYTSYTSMIVEQFIEFSFLDKEISRFFQGIGLEEGTKEKHQVSKQKEEGNKVENSRVGVVVEDESQMWKNGFDLECCSQTIRSLRFQNGKKGEKVKTLQNHQRDPSTRCLQTSQTHPNLLTSNKISLTSSSVYQEPIHKTSQSSPCVFTFDQMFQTTQESSLLTVLRIHLKALDLYIDCVNTFGFNKNQDDKSLERLNKEKDDQDFTMKIQYLQERVLCDTNHQKNSVLLRQNTINLVYLTKDSPIESVHFVDEGQQNKFCQKNNTKINHLSKNPIKHKICRKDW